MLPGKANYECKSTQGQNYQSFTRTFDNDEANKIVAVLAIRHSPFALQETKAPRKQNSGFRKERNT
jgi:hypothetical protein